VVRAYAWRMTVERAPPDINFRYPETRLSSREYAPTNFRCAASASAVSSSSPAVSSRAVRTPADPPPTAGRAEAGRRPLSCRLGSGIARVVDLTTAGAPGGWTWTAWLATRSADCSRSCGWRSSWPVNGTSARPRSCRQTRRGWQPRAAPAALAEPASFTAPPVCRLHSMSRLRSAATVASVLTVFRECGVVRRRRSGPPADHYDQSQPVLLTEVCSGRRRAPWTILQADATVPPHRGGAGMTLP
jgi:hypothetical protein